MTSVTVSMCQCMRHCCDQQILPSVLFVIFDIMQCERDTVVCVCVCVCVCGLILIFCVHSSGPHGCARRTVTLGCAVMC